MIATLTRLVTRLLPAAVLGLFIAGGVLTAGASGPVFNGLSNDYKTLQVAEGGDSAWQPSRSANIGDTLYLLTWVHNSEPDTIAYNTHVTVSIPTGTDTAFQPSVKLTADNAATKSDNVTITVGKNSTLAYIPGSAKLMKNINGTMKFVDWPTNINSDDVVSPHGVSLGNLAGCWQNAQAVEIAVKVNGVTPVINTNKKVAMAGGADYSDATTGQPGSAAFYRVFLQNTGDAVGIAPQIVDTLDIHSKYIPNTAYVRVKQDNVDKDQPLDDKLIIIETLPDGRQRLTFQFKDMGPTPDTAFYLVFEVRLADKTAFPIGTTVMPNVANVSFANSGVVNTNQTTITVVRTQDTIITFDLVKKVQNVTDKDTVWKDTLNGTAAPGDTVAFELIATNTGNTAAQSVTLKDLLPQGMTFVPNSARLYNKGTTDAGTPIPGDDIVKNGYVFSNLDYNTLNQQIIVFQATLTSDCNGVQTLVNTGQIYWSGKLQAQDTASVIFTCKPGIFIRKDVEVPGGTFVDNGGVVPESTVLRYQIIVGNNSKVTVHQPLLRDVLPANVTYNNNSLRVDGEVMSADIQNAFFNQGFVLTDFTPGMTKTITYDVKVNDCPTLGDTTLINTAFVKSTIDKISDISDTATVTVHVTKPILTF